MENNSGTINILDINTINQIAAGEVVEKPSSVIKELVENSIDAGSTKISVEIKEGGISYIRVTDNGDGVAKEDIKKAFLPHATSKLKHIDDLERTITLGFRGEALPSIASVSKVIIKSKTEAAETGYLYTLNGGEGISFEMVGTPKGTTIEIIDLFYNIPVRKSFLKKPSTESSYISEEINRFALANPKIAFKYINNSNVLLQTNGDGVLLNTVYSVLGKNTAIKSVPVKNEGDSISINGLLGLPEIGRMNRTYEYLFINGRFVKNDLVSRAVKDAFGDLLPSNKYPTFVLNLSITPSLIDVNIHPQKLQIRFKDENSVYDFVHNTIKSCLNEKILIPKEELVKDIEVKNAFKESEDVKKEYIQHRLDEINPVNIVYEQPKSKVVYLNDSKNIEYNYKKNEDNKIVAKPIIPQYMQNESIAENKALPITKEERKPFFSDYKICGFIFNTYWIVEQDDKMYMIDQHAAHEKVLYEENFKNKQYEGISQILLTPIIVGVNHKERLIVDEYISIFEKIGFDIEPFSEKSIIIRAVPHYFKQADGAEFFLNILDGLGNDMRYDEETIKNKIATASCREAIKANDIISKEEAEILITKLLALENPFTCPHGRPTIIEISKTEIEKKFKRQ